MGEAIRFVDGVAQIHFNSSFYFPGVVDKAVADFGGGCDIKLVARGLFSTVTIKSKEGLKELTYEFCNYILSLMKDKLVSLAHYVKNE